MSKTPPIKNTRDVEETYLNIVAYGPPGAGKTTFASTFPKPLILSAESGLLSVRDRQVDFWEINTWEDVEEAFRYLRLGEHAYQSVAIDSLTELQKKLNEYIVRKHPNVRRSYEDLASQQDWGANIDKMRKLCRAFRDLPMHVAFLALDATKEVDGEESVTRPALSGKTLPDELCGWVDVVLYLPGAQKDDEGNVYYPAQTVTAKGRVAKFRVPAGTKVPPAISDPTFASVWKIVHPDEVSKRRTSRKVDDESTEEAAS